MKKMLLSILLVFSLNGMSYAEEKTEIIPEPIEEAVLKILPEFPIIYGDIFLNIRTGNFGIGTTTELMSWKFLHLKLGYVSEIKQSPANIPLASIILDFNEVLKKGNIKYIWEGFLNVGLGFWTGVDLKNNPVTFEYGFNINIFRLKI